LFLLVFRPAFPAGNPGNFYHLLITIDLFFIFYALVITPYLALLPDIARTTMERLKLSGWQTIFNVAGVACAVILGDIVRHYGGYQAMALFFAALIFTAFILPGIKIKERTVVHPGPRIGFWKALGITLKNRPFIIYLIGQTFVWFGFSLIQGALRHVVVALMGLQTIGMAKCLFLSLLVAVLCMPLVFKLAHKFGKKRAYIIMVSAFVPLLAAIYLLRSPWIGNFTIPLGYVIFALMGIPISAFFIIPNSILGEIIDYDEKHTRLRREAIYFSTQSLINKTGLAISSILMGFLLSLGFTVDNPFGIRLLGPTAAVFVLVGLIVFSFYPLEDAAYVRGHTEK
jgi:GPH family glycoside/pentoside/hexuronide:cation symporter